MPKAFYIREVHLERLRANVASNAVRYREPAPWLGTYFDGESYGIQSKIEIPDVTLKLPTTSGTKEENAGSKDESNDLENTKTLYEALKHLTPVQASDERLWAYMTHVTHWEYMRSRWAVEQYEKKPKTLAANIQTRYLFMSDRPRALVRNGIARLWWYGYSSYDGSRSDPFELTAVLLKNLDVTQSILERNLSRNRTVTKAILTALLEREQSGKPYYDREGIRNLVKHVRHIGGVTIVDALTFDDVRTLVKTKLDVLAAAP